MAHRHPVARLAATSLIGLLAISLVTSLAVWVVLFAIACGLAWCGAQLGYAIYHHRHRKDPK